LRHDCPVFFALFPSTAIGSEFENIDASGTEPHEFRLRFLARVALGFDGANDGGNIEKIITSTFRSA
jgi:hypothetical protein